MLCVIGWLSVIHHAYTSCAFNVLRLRAWNGVRVGQVTILAIGIIGQLILVIKRLAQLHTLRQCIARCLVERTVGHKIALVLQLMIVSCLACFVLGGHVFSLFASCLPC